MERMAVRAQTVVFDVLLAAFAFSLAFFVAPTQPELGFGQAGALGFFQLAALYAAIAGVFALIFRRELSPWRYVSIPDALVLARIALFRLNRRHLDVQFADGSRWEAPLGPGRI